jgi:flagellum-specific peptidoglycan hydrolase FlgJ
VLIIGLMAVMVSANAQNKAYIANHLFIATILSQSYGIPASLILAVASIESSGGNGPAAKVLNNHFGIEGTNEIVNKQGHQSRYKQYPNEIASYLDFCKLMTRKRFYYKLKNNPNPQAWVKAMSKAHYSEAPEEWEQKVMSMIYAVKSQVSKDFISQRLAVK